MQQITRFQANQRMCEMTVYNGVAYLAGQVPEQTCQQDAYAQTKEVLALIDKLLAEAGTNKSHILFAQIFLADMQDYSQMNQAWDEWVDSENPPARATVQANLAVPQWKLEIVITAAVGSK